MRELWLLLCLSLPLIAFHRVTGCLECDSRFNEEIRALLANLVPMEVPDRGFLLQRQMKETISLSFKVSHRSKMLRVLGEGKLVPLSVWGAIERGGKGENTWVHIIFSIYVIISFPHISICLLLSCKKC